MLGVGEIISVYYLVTVLAGLLGLEREFKDKPAGFRTNVMVGAWFGFDNDCCPCCLMLIQRIAAGVITGIGFIGGGLIIHGKSEVHGITTAADNLGCVGNRLGRWAVIFCRPCSYCYCFVFLYFLL
jgi:putative Mg2+ transporter-C (MgtC) family protein